MLDRPKKILATVAFVVGAILTLTACGDDYALEDKTLTVGSSCDFAPFEFREGGKRPPVGFDIDLINAIGKELRCAVVIKDVSFNELFPALYAGDIDVAISAITITDERAAKVTFTNPYFRSIINPIVRKDETDIKTFENLAGHKVGVYAGTISAAETKKLPNVEVVEYNNTPNLYKDLSMGKLDAVVNDHRVNEYFIKRGNYDNLMALPDMLTYEECGIAVDNKNAGLADKINVALKRLHENGEYDRIYKKWFGKAAEQ